MSKILVTGAAGFVGSWVSEELLNQGHDVYGIDNFQGGLEENIPEAMHMKGKFFNIDLKDKLLAEVAVKELRPEIIHHCAASAREGASFFAPVQMTQDNYGAHINLIEPAIKHGLKHYVCYSSMAVYGEQESPFGEDMKPQPADIYAISKAAMEESTRMLSEVHGFTYTIIRPHNIVGERQSMTDLYRNVASIFMNRIMRKEPLYIYGDGNQKRAFSYILDSLPCYIACTDPKFHGQIFNIGGTQEMTVNELAEKVIKLFSEYGTPKIIHLPERHGEVKYAWCTYEKSQRMLGFKEEYGIDKGLERMAIWCKTKGPQEWTKEILPLVNDKAPSVWNR